MDSEFAPLKGSATNRHLTFWWALNVFLVIFIFLAFVLAAVSLKEVHDIDNDITTNSVVSSSAFIVVENVKVAQNHNVKKGTVVSYTDNPNEVGAGIGPIWGVPAYNTDAFSAAYTADVAQFSDTQYSFYAFVTHGQPYVFHFQVLRTPSSGGIAVWGLTTFDLSIINPDNVGSVISDIRVKIIGPQHYAVLYHIINNSTGNSSYIVTGNLGNDWASFYVNTPMAISSDSANYVVSDIVVVTTAPNITPPVSWLIVFLGINGQTCSNYYYLVDLGAANLLTILSGVGGQFTFTCQWPLRSEFLGSGLFIIGNQQFVALASVDFVGNNVNPLAQLPWGILYESLHFSQIPSKGIVVAVGIQLEGLEQPTPITQIIQWQNKATYLTLQRAVSLLSTFTPTIYRNHIRSLYLPPDNWHPNGALLFTYVDSISGLAVTVRGKLDQYENYYWVIGSFAVLVSSNEYLYRPPGFTPPRQGLPEPLGPLLFGPTAQGQAAYIYHSIPNAYNTFYWQGGYKLAGIASSAGTGGQKISVTRTGTAPSEYPLHTGFAYYANNTGDLHSSLSVSDQFTPNGWGFRIGSAISASEVIIDFEIFDFINNVY